MLSLEEEGSFCSLAKSFLWSPDLIDLVFSEDDYFSEGVKASGRDDDLFSESTCDLDLDFD